MYLGYNEPDLLKKMHNKTAYVYETKWIKKEIFTSKKKKKRKKDRLSNATIECNSSAKLHCRSDIWIMRKWKWISTAASSSLIIIRRTLWQRIQMKSMKSIVKWEYDNRAKVIPIKPETTSNTIIVHYTLHNPNHRSWKRKRKNKTCGTSCINEEKEEEEEEGEEGKKTRYKC